MQGQILGRQSVNSIDFKRVGPKVGPNLGQAFVARSIALCLCADCTHDLCIRFDPPPAKTLADWSLLYFHPGRAKPTRRFPADHV